VLLLRETNSCLHHTNCWCPLQIAPTAASFFAACLLASGVLAAMWAPGL
jgi:hypothetical protein